MMGAKFKILKVNLEKASLSLIKVTV